MIRIERINSANRERFQSFAIANGYFLQSLDWGDFQGMLLGRTVEQLLIFENGQVIGVCQLVGSNFLGKKYFFAPYGPLIMPEHQNKSAQLLTMLAEWASKEHSGVIFVRFEPFIRSGQNIALEQFKKTADQNPRQSLILNLEQSLGQIKEKMHSKTRYNIGLAERKGIKAGQIKISEQHLLDCAVRLISNTAKRAGVRPFPENYYKNLIRFFGGPGKSTLVKVYAAFDGGEMLAANIVIYFVETAVYLFGGSAETKRNLMAPYLLHWKIITDAKESGCKKYDFWGVETDPKHPWSGFSKFKLGFGGEIIKYYGTHDFVLQPAWYNAYRILRKLNRIIR